MNDRMTGKQCENKCDRQAVQRDTARHAPASWQLHVLVVSDDYERL